MKKIILIVSILIYATISNSQTINFLPDNNYTWVKFVPKTYVKEGVGTLLLNQRNLTVWQTGTGQCYIINKSETGREIRQYLGWYLGLNEIERNFAEELITDKISLSKNNGINQNFDELTSPLRLRNTIFYNSDTTKAWTWIIKVQLVKVFLPDGIATQTRELYKSK